MSTGGGGGLGAPRGGLAAGKTQSRSRAPQRRECWGRLCCRATPRSLLSAVNHEGHPGATSPSGCQLLEIGCVFEACFCQYYKALRDGMSLDLPFLHVQDASLGRGRQGGWVPSSHGDGGRWGLLCGVSSAVWGGVWLQEAWAVPCEGHVARSRRFRRTAGPLVGPAVASDPTHRWEASRRELSRSPEFLFAGCRRPRWGLARAWIWWGPLSTSVST